MSAKTEETNILTELAATAAALRLHEQGRIAARSRRSVLVAQARAAGISHGDIARALGSSRSMSQYLVAQSEKVSA